MSCIETRNGSIVDLLDPDLKKLDRASVQKPICKRVKSELDALHLLYTGNKKNN